MGHSIHQLPSILHYTVPGTAYLHRKPNAVIHRDLQPRNVFLANKNGEHLKVGNFGLSKLSRVQSSHEVYRPTDRYITPELFKHWKYDKVDVFSFAMILYEMLEGEPPVSHYEPIIAAEYMAEGHKPLYRAKGFTPELRELIEQCWAADMNRRPPFLEILRLEQIKAKLPKLQFWKF